ncbi:MAG: LuxR C-terminal-related transcriptional regulator [Reichenbachiella sp.]|uniref:response regulator transcription factor n=1 Tax=Reichenbachiella sp. TaxID=2184521 RepID=UPI0032996269
MKQTILIFGSLAAAIFILFELNKLSLWGLEDSSDLFIICSGVLFILIGVLISRFMLGKPENPKFRGLNKSSLTKQEYKILLLMNDGLSNLDIAEQLYISESTVKTHVSNILSKLRAKRRTEAVKIGRDLDII